MVENYFSFTERICPCCGRADMKPDFMARLNALRRACGFPFIINSGYRCPDHNQAVGGKVDSAHVKGRAADISCKDSHKRFLIASHAARLGFRRIGIGKDFVHVDDDESLPQDVLWLY